MLTHLLLHKLLAHWSLIKSEFLKHLQTIYPKWFVLSFPLDENMIVYFLIQNGMRTR